jgi:hypothetical protein
MVLYAPTSSRRGLEPYSNRVLYLMSRHIQLLRCFPLTRAGSVSDPCLKSTSVNRKDGPATRDEKSLTLCQAPSHNTSAMKNLSYLFSSFTHRCCQMSPHVFVNVNRTEQCSTALTRRQDSAAHLQ